MINKNNPTFTIIMLFLLVGVSIVILISFAMNWNRPNNTTGSNPAANQSNNNTVTLEIPNPATPFPTAEPATNLQIEPLPTTAELIQPATPTPLPIEPTPLPPTATPRPEPIIIIDYLVQQNDTLYQVAQTQRSSIELMATYNIAANDLIPGTTIRLPVANPAYCPNQNPYIVREHETVFRIAHAFNKTVDEIAQYNQLDENYNIKTGQLLCIP